jgi:hypothetical protein
MPTDTPSTSTLPQAARSPVAVVALGFLTLNALPVAFRGVRGVWPRTVRAAVAGPIWVGLASLVGMGACALLKGLANAPARPNAGDKKRWRLPISRAILSDDMVASAASGH